MKYISTPSMLTVISEDGGTVLGVPTADISYQDVYDYVVRDDGQDLEHAVRLFAGDKAPIQEAISAVSEAVQAPVEHGISVSSVVFDTARRIQLDGGSPKALGRFAQRLAANPSAASRGQLFSWLAAEGFTVTKKGLIVGYKAVTAAGYSISQGVEPVTVQHQDGTVEIVTGHVPYPVGATVSMNRSQVADDRDVGCSSGLHVGTYGYAEGFRPSDGQVLLVLVDPADVVSVPKDASSQKMRVSRLVVAAVAGEKIPDAVMTVRNLDMLALYEADPENHIDEDYDDEDYDDEDYDEDSDVEYSDEDEDEFNDAQ